MNHFSFVKYIRLVPILLLGLLLLSPSTSVQGACDGLLLWSHVVLPTLSPFIICTQMVVSLGGVELLIRPFYPPLHRFLSLTVSGCYVFLCGLLCGYPLGAKMCADFQKRGSITRKEACYLLAICNHPSPMFLLGYVRGQLQYPVSPLLMLTCLYLPVLPMSFLARKAYCNDSHRNKEYGKTEAIFRVASIEADSVTSPPLVSVESAISIEDVFLSTCETMVIIGGYIMMFSILTTWIQHMTFLPVTFRACLTGLAEITTGIHQLSTLLPPAQSLLPVIAAVAFGGFSGIFQTKSVIKNAGLSIRHYVGWKTLHACLSCIILVLLLTVLPR